MRVAHHQHYGLRWRVARVWTALALLFLCGCGAASWKTRTDSQTGKTVQRLDLPISAANVDAHLRVVPGQYGGYAKIIPDGSLRVAGIHTTTAVWLNRPLGTNYEVRFEFRLTPEGSACWWVGGQGYGNSVDMGYTVVVGAGPALLLRRGAQVAAAVLPPVGGNPAWLPARVSRQGARIHVVIGGKVELDYTDPELLSDSSHAWFGFGAIQGGWESGVLYRNFAIETSVGPADCVLARHPPPTARPRPNGVVLYALDPAAPLSSAWRMDPRDGIAWQDGVLVVGSGGNSTPEMTMRKSLPTPLACEFTIEYPGDNCLNYRFHLWRDDDVPTDPKERRGWVVALPDGQGRVQIAWQGRANAVLAATPYFGPLAREPYRVRVECDGRDLRVFTGGEELLRATMPDGEPEPKSWHVGMSHFYSITHISGLRVCALPLAEDPETAGGRN